MVCYLEVSNVGPEGLGDYAIIDDAANVSYFIGKLALGVSWGTSIKDGKVSEVRKLEELASVCINFSVVQ